MNGNLAVIIIERERTSFRRCPTTAAPTVVKTNHQAPPPSVIDDRAKTIRRGVVDIFGWPWTLVEEEQFLEDYAQFVSPRESDRDAVRRATPTLVSVYFLPQLARGTRTQLARGTRTRTVPYHRCWAHRRARSASTCWAMLLVLATGANKHLHTLATDTKSLDRTLLEKVTAHIEWQKIVTMHGPCV